MKIEKLQSAKEIEASQEANSSTTKRAEPVVEYLYPAPARRKPLPDQFVQSGEVEEDKLQQDKIEEENSLQEQDTDVHHHCRDR
jgi:hypothetical protein